MNDHAALPGNGKTVDPPPVSIPIPRGEARIRACKVGRIMIGSVVATAVAQWIEYDGGGDPELVLYLANWMVTDAEAVGLRLPFR